MANQVENEDVPELFVAKIPKFAKEEDLNKIFSVHGPVVHFKLFRNSTTRESLGAGLCKYEKTESFDNVLQKRIHYHGHVLRVQNAANEPVRQEIENILKGPQPLSFYGPECAAEEAPYIITNTMASLPPERLHEIILEMKQYIQEDPAQAAKILEANPQLAYAVTAAVTMTGIISEDTAEIVVRTKKVEPVSTSSSPPPAPQEKPRKWPLPPIPQHHIRTFGGMRGLRPVWTFRPRIPYMGPQMPNRAPPRYARYPRIPRFSGPRPFYRARGTVISTNPEQANGGNFLYGRHNIQYNNGVPIGSDRNPRGSDSIHQAGLE